MVASRSAWRIAYLLVCHDIKHSGVFKKIRDQVTQWEASGHTVQLFVISDKESLVQWRELYPTCVLLVDGNIIRKIWNRFRLVSYALETEPTLIYLRDSFPMRIPKSRTPLVMEVQTLVEQELRLRRKFLSLVFKLLKIYVYRNVDGAVFVTNELMRLNEFRLLSTTPKIVIGNGIDLSKIEVLPLPKFVMPAIFFVGTPNQPWHGVSELTEFARTNPDVQVEVVGILEKVTIPNITFHGVLSPMEYRFIASKCIAGVGTLNLSAKGMKEASSLKTREYLALGLPVILKYRDMDLDPTSEFVLQLPDDGRVLSEFSNEIRMFLDSWTSKRVSHSQIRDLDVSLKEQRRLEFFSGVVRRNPVN